MTDVFIDYQNRPEEVIRETCINNLYVVQADQSIKKMYQLTHKDLVHNNGFITKYVFCDMPESIDHIGPCLNITCSRLYTGNI